MILLVLLPRGTTPKINALSQGNDQNLRGVLVTFSHGFPNSQTQGDQKGVVELHHGEDV